MNPAVFVILAVVGLSAAAPQPSGHGSSFKHKTEYEKACETVYETIYETACDVTYKKECYGYGYDKKCKSVPVEKCHQVPKQVPVQVPEKKCDSYGPGHSSGYPHH